MIVYHLVAITLAVIIDRLIGDPKWLPHPVVGIGKLISFLEKHLNRGSNKKGKGILFLILVIFLTFIVVLSLTIVAYIIHPIVGIVVESVLISLTIAAKGLKEAAEDVAIPLKQRNMNDARLKLSYIVGRDTENLNEGEIVRGTVETVAENTSDGVTSPLFFALIGGAPLAFVYRAVNTCDSMVGYKNERYLQFGWASARFDDVLNWLPARMTGILMVLFNKSCSVHTKKDCFQILFHDAKKHPSPNSGWGEAAVASLLGVQLGGRNTYKGMVSNRTKMGRPEERLRTIHIQKTITIMFRTVISYVVLLWLVGGVALAVTKAWS
ncbi:adenosylcobinamide-phosphate synthase CbiB [Bacillus sp. FJAT-45350]|uniref:adenosylcobinamide-phosphate synthase CbiB n=1 Tax=Bacillus sp. FJAT-45350 TaxID=2011014 RepID=UPI000BB7FBAD|nr:adenosylcobinamide-phosphate synthase CbiB [Bacillus sp. FJAT-45350]